MNREATTQDAIAYFHKIRRKCKGRWFTCCIATADGPAEIKAYGTWIQRIEWNGVVDSGPMDCKVSEVTEFLRGLIG